MLVKVTLRDDHCEHPGVTFDRQLEPQAGGDIVRDSLSAIVAEYGCRNIETVAIGSAIFDRWDIAFRLGLNVPGM